MKKKMHWIAAVILGTTLASPSSWANLVVNGDFETPVVTAPVGYEYRTGSDLTGWTIFSPVPHRGVPQFNAAYGQPLGGGLQSLQIEYPGDYIEQSIATIAGEAYILSFDLSAYFPPGASVLDVEIDGGAPFTFFGSSIAGYVHYVIPFVATGATTLIHFESNIGATGTYPHIDNIVVPEPGSLALAGIALAALGLVRRRKRA